METVSVTTGPPAYLESKLNVTYNIENSKLFNNVLPSNILINCR